MRRPNRSGPRKFTAKQIGKLVCRYLSEKGPDTVAFSPTGSLDKDHVRAQLPRAALREELDKCFPCDGDADLDESAVADVAVVAQLEATTSSNQSILAVAAAVLVALAFLPRLLGVLPRLLLPLVPVAGRVAVQQIPALLTRVRAQEAANDAVIRVIKTLKRAA